MNTKNILFVIPGMHQGGAERVVSLMANYWAKKNNRVSIIVFNNNDSFYTLDKAIKIYKLNSAKNTFGWFSFLINNVKRTTAYFKYVKLIKPDVIISFTDNANVYCILYNYFFKKPLIITQRTNPDYDTLPKIIKWLPAVIYKKASAMVLQTAQTIAIYKQLKLKLPLVTRVINNPLSPDIYAPQAGLQRKNIVLAVGRLYNKDKHFDKLIDIFTACNNSNWQLHIAGDGEDFGMLKNKIENLNLAGKVQLLGSINDLKPIYQGAKIFALTSQFEGFPNALCEAMANGCACISFNCPTGPAEIIVHGVNGILIELGNETGYAEELNVLMNDDEKIKRLSDEACKLRTVLDEGIIMQQWEELINDLLLQTK
jgi:GalNAc-alpha-(1->4)-GalNAc-alpha-(1->3)-diNAcBac-PP-undecaprenol alpha-1,4-N-acetyl-D-galactosaminyltransferase